MSEADKDEMIRLQDEALDEMGDRIRDLHIEMDRLQKLLTDNGIEFEVE